MLHGETMRESNIINQKEKIRRGGRGRSGGFTVDQVLNDGRDDDYALRRKEFYTKLENSLGRAPDVNQITGRPLDFIFILESNTRTERVSDGL
eukprot:UN15523